jgi:general stress protein 26
MSSQDPQTQAREKLWALIKDIRFAMFTTRHANGHLHACPMTTQNQRIDEDERLWFFMSRLAHPVQDIGEDTEVNIGYAHPGEDRYVSVSGRARVVENPAKKGELWNKLAEAWFPAGVNDPRLALVEVRITHANYWDVKESKLTQLFVMAKAVVTGRPPGDIGETGEIRMQGRREMNE